MEAHFKIFNLPICITSNSPQFLQDFGDILHHFRVPGSDPGLRNSASFHVAVDQGYTITDGNQIIYRSSNYRYILEYLEYEIYSLLIDRLSNRYLIHAGAVAHRDRVILLPAKSGGGKTTLIAGLLKNGFRYLTDEIAVIDPQTLEVYPFPKPLNVKIGSLSLFADFGPEMQLIGKNGQSVEKSIHHVLVNSSFIHAMDKPLPVRDIIFVQYDPQAECRLTPVSRANAIFEMARCSFNQYRFKEKGIEILDSLVRGCQCYHLKFSQASNAVHLIKEL